MKARPPVTAAPAVPDNTYKPDPNEVTVFAMTTYRKRMRKFGIKLDDRRRHMYLVGKTGMGKSTLLENMIISDIVKGKGLAVVDPHGDLVEKVLKFVPDHRINDIVYFNPSDGEYPIAFNIVESINPEYKNLIASGLVGVFKKIWADSWGPRLEYILINSILALLDYPGSTLLGVTRLLVDKKYRKKIVSEINDPVVKSFWVDEYANYSEKFRTEAIAPIQNKVGQFLSSSIIRNIVGQSKSTIDMREIMDSGKILLMNLAKGRIGEENSALLGAMMITKLQLAAMSRVDIPEPTRRDFYLYVDEFQNFATESFANILSEARKYRLNLIIAHQYIEQLGEVVKPAVFGNVGTMIVFRIGAADAAEFETEFDPTFLPADLVNLPKFHMYMKLMIDGVSSTPFSAIGLPPAEGETNNLEKIIRASRERYANPKAVVEEKIMDWAGMGEEAGLLEGETEEGEAKPEKVPTLNPREFKERMKLIQGSEQKIVPELAQTEEVKQAQSVSLMDALKGGKTLNFSGKPSPAPSKPAQSTPPKPTVSPTPSPQASQPGVRVPGAPLPKSTPPVRPPVQAPKSQPPVASPVKPQPLTPPVLPKPEVVTPTPQPMTPKPQVPVVPHTTQANGPKPTMPPVEPLDLGLETSISQPATVTPPTPQPPATTGMSLTQLQRAPVQSFDRPQGGGGQGGQPGQGRNRKRRRRGGGGGGSASGGQLPRPSFPQAPSPQIKPPTVVHPTTHPEPRASQPIPKPVLPPTPLPATTPSPSPASQPPKGVAPSFLNPAVNTPTPPPSPSPEKKQNSAPSFIKPTE